MMPRVIEVVMGPSMPETGEIARAVTLDNGWGQVQTYSKRRKAWVKGGTTLQSLWAADVISEESLKQNGFDAEDIRNIFWRPENK